MSPNDIFAVGIIPFCCFSAQRWRTSFDLALKRMHSRCLSPVWNSETSHIFHVTGFDSFLNYCSSVCVVGCETLASERGRGRGFTQLCHGRLWHDSSCYMAWTSTWRCNLLMATDLHWCASYQVFVIVHPCSVHPKWNRRARYTHSCEFINHLRISAKAEKHNDSQLRSALTSPVLKTSL